MPDRPTLAPGAFKISLLAAQRAQYSARVRSMMRATNMTHLRGNRTSSRPVRQVPGWTSDGVLASFRKPPLG